MSTLADMQAKCPWTEDMGEISGFGGAYEDACRQMLWQGLLYLEGLGKEEADSLAKTARWTSSFLWHKNPALKAFDEAICGDVDPSGAMFGAAVGIILYVWENGWEKFQEARREGKRKWDAEKAAKEEK